jgi:hypothetical protein
MTDYYFQKKNSTNMTTILQTSNLTLHQILKYKEVIGNL